MHPVIGGIGFSTQYGDREAGQSICCHQLFDEVMTDHAIADDQQLLFLNHLGLFGEVMVYLTSHAIAYHHQFLFIHLVHPCSRVPIQAVRLMTPPVAVLSCVTLRCFS